ncbi:MAG: hypothetical protein M3Q70_00435 [bacterium]|nr:hypothetical protein [bacterium]
MHAAKTRKTYWPFAAVISICAVLSWIFYTRWYISALNLGAFFVFLTSAIAVLQLLFAWVPDSKGISSKVHRTAAYAWVFLLYVSFFVIIFSVENVAVKVTSVIVIAILTYLGGVFVRNKYEHKNYLTYQLVCIMTIHLGVIFTAYLA